MADAAMWGCRRYACGEVQHCKGASRSKKKTSSENSNTNAVTREKSNRGYDPAEVNHRQSGELGGAWITASRGK